MEFSLLTFIFKEKSARIFMLRICKLWFESGLVTKMFKPSCIFDLLRIQKSLLGIFEDDELEKY